MLWYDRVVSCDYCEHHATGDKVGGVQYTWRGGMAQFKDHYHVFELVQGFYHVLHVIGDDLIIFNSR